MYVVYVLQCLQFTCIFFHMLIDIRYLPTYLISFLKDLFSLDSFSFDLSVSLFIY